MTAISHPAGIKALGLSELERFALDLGEPRFRVRQIVRWLYGRGVRDWSEMTDLPLALRSKLAEQTALTGLELLEMRQSSIDGTRKYLWRLADGTSVESVGLPTERRLTVCFSTQAGCAMGCRFCATGQQGLGRDLVPGEMVDQVRLVGEDFGCRVTNAVAMGQGEPFANYDATIASLRLMNSADALGIGARHLTISTCGLISGIDRLTREPEQFTLAVSLHSAVQTTRDYLMPGVRGATLPKLRDAVERYTLETGRRVSFEFALIRNVNDSDREIQALADFCRGLLCHVNLIPMNPVDGTNLDTAANDIAARVSRTLIRGGTESTIRTERGADIEAACGQLKQRYDQESDESRKGASQSP